MMARELADETLAVILEQCLVVSDNDFACTNSRASPFANIREPSSNYLVVCKRWMRICTPLLYHTIILRSQPQATALAAVLRPKAHPEFGNYIRKMRVEGGYGSATKQILLAAPKITDICVTLDLYAADNVEPMCSVMATAFQPQHLILASSYDSRERTNKQLNTMLTALHNCIGTWKSLNRITTFDLLFRTHEHLGRAIVSANNIREICLADGLVRLDLGELIGIALQPHIVHIIIRQTASAVEAALLDQGQQGLDTVTPKLRAKLIFDGEPVSSRVIATTAAIVAQTNPFFAPLANAPRPLRRTIWGLVLAATFDHSPKAPTPANSMHPRSRAACNVQYMLVCREWFQVMRCICVARPVLRYTISALGFVDFIQSSGLGWRTTRMTVADAGGGMMRDGLLSVANIIYPTLTQLPLLHTLKAHDTFDPQTWIHFCRGPASSIVVLTILLAAGRYEVPRMPLLATLDIDTHRGARIELHGNQDCVFPTLLRLEVHDHTPTATIMEFLASQRLDNSMLPTRSLNLTKPYRLPSFAHLGFAAPENNISSGDQQLVIAARERLERRLATFFSRHGTAVKTIAYRGRISITKFTLSHCPNLISLEMRRISTPPTSSEVILDQPHEYLQKLLLPMIYDSNFDAKTLPRIVAPWNKFFDAIQTPSLPALRSIGINQENVWPTTNRNTSKHPLLAAAESLWEQGVRLCDIHGMYWKPRLQGRGRKK